MEVPAGAAPLKSQPHSPPLFPQQIPTENLLCSDTRYSDARETEANKAKSFFWRAYVLERGDKWFMCGLRWAVKRNQAGEGERQDLEEERELFCIGGPESSLR